MLMNTKFLTYAAGIFLCYFYFGMLQESITRGTYGDERFTCALCFVLVQCIFNYIFAKAMMTSKNPPEDTRTFYYISSALTYLLAMVCSNLALQWVNYPTQVVGKSAKPIPVMILGVLIGHKKYPLKRYLFVLMIVIGVIMFMYKDQVKKVTNESTEFGVGEILLLLSLTMDGLTGAVQDRMRAESSPSAQYMMLNTNYWSNLILGTAVVLSGELKVFVLFVIRHPEIIWHLITLGLAGALGQLFIFLAVSQFGPLACSVVTTTRKFFTVLASVLIFGNTLSSRQWLGAVVVFSGLFLDMFYGKKTPSTRS
ncbi:solute carrier family 35 member B1 homolog meigo isoform X1 [Arctopsyche grandis]|uniref:solute carrier family 35 member B1 homolog meigo isoform X1 n=1 Tax=Arctopsyche grandis TaxID=121162 RepID=UPI00406D9A5C